MPGPVLETVRRSVLSRELQLQMQIGNCVEALLLLNGGSREPAVLRLITQTAARLRDGADDSTAGPRTVGQTTQAIGVLRAASLAHLGEEQRDITAVLRDLAAGLEAATSPRSAPVDTTALIDQLARLHAVLAGLTGSRPDETEGLGRFLP